MNDIDCEKCKQNMIKSYGDEAKFRMKLIKWDKTGMYAVCKSCGHDNPITADLLKSIESNFVYEVGPDKSQKN